jgi:hypothetical protein
VKAATFMQLGSAGGIAAGRCSRHQHAAAAILGDHAYMQQAETRAHRKQHMASAATGRVYLCGIHCAAPLAQSSCHVGTQESWLLCCAGAILQALAGAARQLNVHLFKRAASMPAGLLFDASVSCQHMSRLLSGLWHALDPGPVSDVDPLLVLTTAHAFCARGCTATACRWSKQGAPWLVDVPVTA